MTYPYVEKLAEEYAKKKGPFVVVMGCADPRIEAAIRKAFEAGFEEGQRAAEPRDAIDM